jgi:anti-sigma regulatory factor (Ser/Thr protein kinase)
MRRQFWRFLRALKLHRIYHSVMLKEAIALFLLQNPCSKAKTIAAHLDEDKGDVNKVLYSSPADFKRDLDHFWSIADPDVLEINLPGDSWVTAHVFENALRRAGSPLDTSVERVRFILLAECKLMLDALARLLALCNQLVEGGRDVELDFSASKSTLSYLNRIGFLNQLADAVVVIPKRPKLDLASTYKGHNDGVVELQIIDPAAPDKSIPNSLRHSFVQSAGDSYSDAAFTVLAELLDNVHEHSRATTKGFAGLQVYRNGKGKRILAVISDNGLGIVGTLEPILKKRYPSLYRRIKESRSHLGVALLKRVFSDGGISQVDEDGRGLGLKVSGDYAKKYRATISVRQKDFELCVHRGSLRRFTSTLNLARVEGTHICFDFQVD